MTLSARSWWVWIADRGETAYGPSAASGCDRFSCGRWNFIHLREDDHILFPGRPTTGNHTIRSSIVRVPLFTTTGISGGPGTARYIAICLQVPPVVDGAFDGEGIDVHDVAADRYA